MVTLTSKTYHTKLKIYFIYYFEDKEKMSLRSFLEFQDRFYLNEYQSLTENNDI
jgi:hypothetical protein